MVKQKASDVKKEIEEQQKNLYGESTISGSAPDPSSDDDVDEIIEEVTDKEPGKFEPVNLAGEIDEDEKALHGPPEIEKDEDEDE